MTAEPEIPVNQATTPSPLKTTPDTAIPWLARAVDLVLGGDPHQRLRLGRALTSMLVFLVCIVLAEYAVRHQMARATFAHLLQAGMLTWMAAVFITLRSGFNKRFADPALTLTQIVGASTWITVAYAIFAPVRGALLMLLALTLVFGIFNLNARGRRICNSYAMALMGITMVIMSRLDPDAFPPHEEIIHFLLVVTILPVVSMLGAQLGNIRLRLRRQRDELEKAFERIREMATRDELTGLHNRRYMLDRFAQQISRMERSGARFCVCIADLDHFKHINDAHGHGVGDEVLCKFADIARTSLRESDLLARWGGEEFLFLLPDTGADQASVSIERVRASLAAQVIVAALPSLTVTFSAGLTEFRHGESADHAIERADLALYRAKNQGRNRTVLD
ncbi:MAG: GGDEF domain-containing protein [Methyloversatilis sp.]|jgi:diguanylate cyclase (GGDEF)-like protein|nr:GGDEF domain-containing protein [Methyloversatilis sp.]MBP6192766.1 GGDEF domain-containing protein [Methyloversatilis sp.]MBP9118351.1 GGDEF domain-containing protein [Methyloversatilis sp.]